jgi:hypothetical protein
LEFSIGKLEDVTITRSLATVTSSLNGQEIDRQTVDASATADDDADVSFGFETIAPRLGLTWDVGRDGGTTARYRLWGHYGRYWPELTSQPTDRTLPSLTLEGSGTIFGGGVEFDYPVSDKVWLWGSYEIGRGGADMSSDRRSPFPSFDLRQDASEIDVLDQQLKFGVGRRLGRQVALRGGITGNWTSITLTGQYSIVDDDAGAAVGIPNQVAEILTTFAEDFDANAIAAVLGADVCDPSGQVCGSADVLSNFNGARRLRFGGKFRF